MAGSDQEQRNSDHDSWLRTLYELAHSDTRWAKEQGWRVVNWSLLLFAALLAVAKYLLSHLQALSFIPIATAVAVLAIIYLVHLNQFAAISRRRTDQIRDLAKLDPALLGSANADPDHMVYLTFQVVIVVVSLVLDIVALLYLG